jgi:hypothetical protein
MQSIVGVEPGLEPTGDDATAESACFLQYVPANTIAVKTTAMLVFIVDVAIPYFVRES